MTDNSCQKKLIKLMTTAFKLFKVKSEKLPIICIFSHDDFELVAPVLEDYEEERLDCRCYSSNSNLDRVLIQNRPNVIITDHATNIAEDVIFMLDARVIKHHADAKEEGEGINTS